MSDSHGNTVGAWTGTVIISLGALLACLGVVWGTSALWIIGAVLCVVGAIAWNVMEKSAKKRTSAHR